MKLAGSYYEAAVPDTLDLAERARAAVNGLVGLVDRSRRFQPHQAMRHYRNPPVLSPEPGGYLFDCGNEMWGKHLEALIEMRLVSGSDQEPGVDEQSLAGMVSCIEDDGLFYSYVRKTDGDSLVPAEDFADLVGGARVMLALIARHQLDGNPQWSRVLARLAKGFQDCAVHTGDMAYYPDGHLGGAISRPRSGWKDPHEPAGTSLSRSRDWYECASNVIFTYGGIAQALCRWHLASGDPRSLDLAGRIARFMMQARFWQPDAAPEGLVAPEHAHFEGHIHATARGLWGLLEYAAIANDDRIKEFVRDGYHYIRSFGIARIGLFGEVCAVGDMTSLAARLTDCGVGDYWEDVDQYMRNHLAEVQILDAEPIRRIAEASPAVPVKPWEDPEGFVERTMGVLCDDALHPSISTPGLMSCCTYNGLIGYYHAWESIVRCRGGAAEVNLLLNRASPWLDVEASLPFEGRAVIRNKGAQTISVRLPRWVDRRATTVSINGRRIDPVWLGGRLHVTSLKPRDVLALEFPVVESSETATVGWSTIHVPGWTEVTRLLDQDKPIAPTDYQVSAAPRERDPLPVFTMRFRGNDLVDISPRETGLGYPLYRRDHVKAGPAPTRKVKRFAAHRVVEI